MLIQFSVQTIQGMETPPCPPPPPPTPPSPPPWLDVIPLQSFFGINDFTVILDS